MPYGTSRSRLLGQQVPESSPTNLVARKEKRGGETESDDLRHSVTGSSTFWRSSFLLHVNMRSLKHIVKHLFIKIVIRTRCSTLFHEKNANGGIDSHFSSPHRALRSAPPPPRETGSSSVDPSPSFTAPTHATAPAVPAAQDDVPTRSDSALSTQHSALKKGTHHA
jgi:hypothetical protein